MKSKIQIILCLFAGMCIASCAQKEEPDPITPEQPDAPEIVEPGTPAEYSYIFKLGGEDGSKAVFESNYVNWEDGDLVASYASTSKNQSSGVSVSGSNVTITVKSSVALTAGDVVNAYYPYKSANDSKGADGIKMEIPSKQVNGDADAMPMVALPFTLTGSVAADTDTEVGTLQFMNLGSIIKLNIYSATWHGETIQKVTFKPGVACAGEFEYDLTGVSATPAAISGYEETEVVVTGSETVGEDAAHGGVFYIVVAPGTYGGKYIISTDRTDYTYTSAGTRTYERAHIKPLNINLDSANWTASTAIATPQDLVDFLSSTSSSDVKDYVITADLDMNGKSITSASGFNGTLDGRGHTISKLTSSVPLFASNSGLIKDLVLDESCVFTAGSNVFGPLVAEDDGGVYASVRNKGAVTYTATGNVATQLIIGGLIGSADGATLTSCTNSGAVTIAAAGYNHQAVGLGGLVGYAEATSFTSCVNRGPVTLNADYGDPRNTLSGRSNGGINVGGVLGAGQDYSKDNYCIFKDCQNQSDGVITLNHTKVDNLTISNTSTKSNRGNVSVGGVIGRARGNVKTCKNFAAVNVDCLSESGDNKFYRQNYVGYVGGIAGLGLWCLSFESCTNDGALTVNYDGTWDKWDVEKAAVGGICGREDDDSDDAEEGKAGLFAYYCKNTGDITVNRNGEIGVGGIFGINGKQIGNQVSKDCAISVTTRWAYVGGLVGIFTTNPYSSSIQRGSCAATITADLYGGQADNTSFNVGGLVGKWASSTAGASSRLYQYNGVPCSFTGTLSSTAASNVGIIIGRVSVKDVTLVFGDSSPMIQASGSIAKNGLSETAITGSNIGEYAVGGNAGATLTMNVEYVAP